MPSPLMPVRPSNAAFMLRSVARRNASPPALRGLGDYVADIPYRTLATRGSDGQGVIGGPLSYPTIPAPLPTDAQSLLLQIRDLLERMPQALQLEFRTRFAIPPREAISFAVGSADVSVAAGAAVAVISEVIDERFTGFLSHVGMNVIAPGSFSSIVWQIRVNGAIHPKFANRIFSQNTLSTPYPFLFELTQSRTLQLVAINTAAIPITVQGVLLGWTEFMATYKPYGSSPQSGVA